MDEHYVKILHAMYKGFILYLWASTWWQVTKMKSDIDCDKELKDIEEKCKK